MLNAVREGAMTQIDGKWGLRWDAVNDEDSIGALISALTPPTGTYEQAHADASDAAAQPSEPVALAPDAGQRDLPTN